MRRLVIALAAVATASFAVSASAQEVRSAPDAPPGLQLDESQNASHAATRTYVIQLKDKPGISYDGGVAGFAATAPGPNEQYNANASHVQQYTAHLVSSHDSMLDSIGAGGAKIYSYSHTINGFAAALTPAEAEILRGNKNVQNVIEDFAMQLDTNNSPAFLGLTDPNGGLWQQKRLKGDDVIVGIMDTGAVQEHPSFSDRRQIDFPSFCDDPQTVTEEGVCNKLQFLSQSTVFGPPPAHWNGICQEGEAWSASDCNNKMIGARYFPDGSIAATGGIHEREFLSARDSDGHGSHTASTAVGNEVEASLGGVPLTDISGMAPRARLAVYKVCWTDPTGDNSCFFSDSAAATDAAVADGVDVLSFSVGTAASFTDPVDLAFLDATAAGVFVSRSAGNSGPNPATTNAGAPWVTSVAASTLDGTGFALVATVNSPASVAGDYTAVEGAITRPLNEVSPLTDDVIAADPIDACAPLNNSIGGQIALIARGTCAFVTKVENAVDAGAAAVLMYTDSRAKTAMGGTATTKTSSIPGVMIDNDIGVALLGEITDSNTVNATLTAGNYVTETLEGNIMAGFSSRGPYRTEPNWIKPDITAPGVRILAGNTPTPAFGAQGELFQYLSGTSMSAPHIAGLAALVRQAHPDWSPAQVKSALMTTARQDVVKEDGATPADPFDFGGGHVDPNKAVSPSLTYDAGLLDYLVASCGTEDPLLSPGDCDFVENVWELSTHPSDLNLPSIGIGELPGSQTITRTVTAVQGMVRSWSAGQATNAGADPWGPLTYTAQIEAPEGYSVSVSPGALTLDIGESASYDVTITNNTAPPGEWRFGALTWTNPRKTDVRSPIAVNAVALVAPEEISGEGEEGTADFDVTFGYSGEYSAGTHGLNDAGLWDGSVEDDPGNNFVFLGAGTSIAFLDEVPADTMFARWSTFNEYTTGNDDIDLYLYYCPNFSCTQIDSSGNADSNEEVSVDFPVNDPNITDPYLVFTHGFNTEGGDPAGVILFAWTLGVNDDAGNMAVTAPGSATLGQTESITVDWAGLNTGTAFKQLGAVSHSDGGGIKQWTLISIANDAGGSACDFFLHPLCAPP